MSSTAKAHEPSMEEILASIRRIIADDEPAAAEKPAAAPSASAPSAAAKTAAEPAPDSELNQDDIDAMLASFDSPPVPGKEPEPEPAAAESKDDDVFDLIQPVSSKPAFAEPLVSEIEFRDAAVAEPEEDLSGWGNLEEEAAPAPAFNPATAPKMVARSVEEALLAPEAGSAVASAFSSLAHTILGQNARTLDDLVEEMLRPMLKHWLDDNLPNIVERLVRAEIERVSRGPRR